MSDILDTIPFDYIFDNIKSNNLSVKSTVKKELNLLFCDSQNSQINKNNEKEENYENNLDEEYSDIIDNTLSNDNIKKNKNRISKLLIIILYYLNYVNYKKTNKNNILIKSKL